MKYRIYIVTWANGFFGSAGQSWISLDVKVLEAKLKSLGQEVVVVPINLISCINLNKEDIVIYNSSDQDELRSYIKDVIYIISKKCRVIPSLDALMSHENKGFQELFRREHEFGSLPGCYFVSPDENTMKPPYVLKSVSGAGSSGVWLVSDEGKEKALYSKFFSVSITRKLKLMHRKLKLSTSEFSLYKYRHSGLKRFVSQEFIPALSGDYKVLVFSNKYYVLKRNVRKNDFRASGSGNFNFENVPTEVLDYARSVFDKLDEPYASLDIAVSGNQAYLIEYQILNFGPYTLKNSNGYYNLKNDEWVFVEKNSCLENEFGEALVDYIVNKKN
ncbi:hypothetical protein VagYM19_02130 [Vibrio alginolyticus]|uniref:hypothetical protein n=1 Tax=Vibrio diabolicus TaxID=50719 RepID=UPI0014356D16|nr:hypothetical protein Vag1382_02130 [Vibrio alginolyticus]BCB45687.1 hypothetical protein VagVIO5_02130 [Vibrio alginolyticus]BCB50287.1 hypothetical protein VagYM19_02130 [Vibrio alginolyticus]BCB54890.1 hypothetical protein VagYM4_02130 [Vibrio alginolyticus]